MPGRTVLWTAASDEADFTSFLIIPTAVFGAAVPNSTVFPQKVFHTLLGGRTVGQLPLRICNYLYKLNAVFYNTG
jgi:hypothetical protein